MVIPLTLVLLLAGDPPLDAPGDPPPEEAADVAATPEAPLLQTPPAEPPAPEPPPPENPPQSHPPVGPPPPHTGVKATIKAIPGDFAALPTNVNLGILGFAGVSALAAHAFDDNVNEHFNSGTSFFYAGKYLGNGVVLFGISLGTYGYGRLTDNRVVSHLGMDLLRSAVVAGTVTYAIKLTVRRDRPNGNCCSFPSGHASGTFAFASVLWRHLGWKAAVPTYTVATYVALSRLHEDVHFLSDVVFGSAVGIVSGRAVTHHDRHFYGLYPMPVPGGGMGVAFVASFR
jgi:membrane-associated phospholipid phosphatase